MRLLIDIDKNDYEKMKNGYVPSTFNLFYVIKNGTPLPKGHGDLIDADALRKIFIEDWKTKKDEDIGTLQSAWAVTQIDKATTIIEADTESEK